MHRIGTIDAFPGETGTNYATTISPDKMPHGKYSLLAVTESDAGNLERTVEDIEKLIYDTPRHRDAAERIVTRMSRIIAGARAADARRIEALQAKLDDVSGSAGAWMDGEGIAEDALDALISKQGAKGDALHSLLQMGGLYGIEPDADRGERFWGDVRLDSGPEWAGRVVEGLDRGIRDALIGTIPGPGDER